MIDGVELTRMDIIWEILAKYLAIGIAAAAAFVIASHALNYKWLWALFRGPFDLNWSRFNHGRRMPVG
jgi:hypothetical protein